MNNPSCRLAVIAGPGVVFRVRSRPLDILRALAIFLVLGRHLVPCPIETSWFANLLTETWHRGGWAGVDLFFVLSGFLVSGLLFSEYLKTGKVRRGRFLIRRGFKIYPPFYLLILATVIFIRHWITGPKLLAELLFVQNYFQGLWGHTWSLAVEEHFYLLLTCVIGVLATLRRTMPLVFAIIAIVCLVARIYTARHFPFSDETNVFPTHLRLDSLAFGVFLAYLKYYRGNLFSWLQRGWFLIPGACALTIPFLVPLDSPYMYTAGFVVNYVGSGMCLLGALSLSATSWPARALAMLGERSYSLYLWHVPVAMVAWRFASHWPVYAGIYLVGAIAVGVAMNMVFETPMLKIREYFYPASSAPKPA